MASSGAEAPGPREGDPSAAAGAGLAGVSLQQAATGGLPRAPRDALDLVLLGPVGAGKGTQARLIATKTGVPHVASGDLLRAHRAKGTELGKQAEAYMQSGSLVPDNLVIDMIVHRMRETDAAHGVLLDGFPRTVAQARALDEELAHEGRSLKLVVYLNVPVGDLMHRLAGRWTCPVCGATYHYAANPPRVAGKCDLDGGDLYQREDDREDVVSKRIDVYLRDTAPVVDYYRAAGILHEVDGSREIAQVARAVEEIIDTVLAP